MTDIVYTRKNAPQELLQVKEWEDVTTSHLDASARLRIVKLTQAIVLYIGGSAIKDCLEGSSLSCSQLLRAFRRCITRGEDGRPIGWSALLSHRRVRAAKRRKPLIPNGRNGRGGLTGALNVLWEKEPTLHEAFDAYLVSCASAKPGSEARVRHRSAHAKFVQLCQQAGLEDAHAWPFNTRKWAKSTIRTYVQRFLSDHYDQIVETQYGSKAKAKSRTGRGLASRLTADRPLDVVEIDEHKCHFIGSIGFRTPAGTNWVANERITIIVAIERTLGVILAYKAIFSREADHNDLLDVLALVCGAPRDRLFEAGMQPDERAEFPTDLGGPFGRCGFNQLLLDNALMHLAEPVLERVQEVIGCDINFGPVARFERRATVEGMFAELERQGFHRLPCTTGTGPGDPRRQKPAQAACELKLSVAKVLGLVEAVIADHNGKKGKSAFGRSRLARLEAWIADEDGMGMLFPQLPSTSPGVADLDASLQVVTVRGRNDRGRRPYVYFAEEDYGGQELADRWDLVGERLIARFVRADISDLTLFSKTGERIASVRVRGRWSRTPHSMDLRRRINEDIRDGQLKVGYDEDPVHAWLNAIAKDVVASGKADRRAVSVAADEERHALQRAAKTARESLNVVLKDTPKQESKEDEEAELLVLDDLQALPGDSL